MQILSKVGHATLKSYFIEKGIWVGYPTKKNEIKNAKPTLAHQMRTIFHWLALGLQGLALGPQGLALGPQGILDTKMLVSAMGMSRVGDYPTLTPNADDFALQWNIDLTQQHVS